MRRTSGLSGRHSSIGITIKFEARVFQYILDEISKYPGAEEGGKFIGIIENERKPHSVLIADFLPGGPQAKRSAVEFLPDGDFQEKMFRTIERADPDVEHVGSWHTLHCNGLNQLSRGDIEGYFRTVNKMEYRPAFFVASLVTSVPNRPADRGWIQHYLFRRGDDEFYEITNDVEIVESNLRYGKWTGHDYAGTSVEGEQWFSSEIGRTTLAEDKRFLDLAFTRTSSTLRKGQVRTCCEMAGGMVTVTYPTRLGDSKTTVDVDAPEAKITMHCDLKSRKAAFRAAIAALNTT